MVIDSVESIEDIFCLQNFFLRRKNTDTKEKIQRGWKKKAPHFEAVAQKDRYKKSQKGKKFWRKKTDTRFLHQWF